MPKTEQISVDMDINQIKGILPQRYPFLMVDRILEVKPSDHSDGRTGRKVVIQKNVTVNEPYFTGHFPDFPLMPGVLQIEGMAQACAINNYEEPIEGEEMVITGVNKAKFRRPVVPGDVLHISSIIRKHRSRFAIFECQVIVGNDVVAEAEIMASRIRTVG